MVNADRIASGLSAFAPETVAFEAGRIMLKRIDSLLANQASFSFETTLSSKTFLKLVERAKKQGYRVELNYVALPSVALAKKRVSKRVAEGGHGIPPEVVERRFYRSLNNLIHRYSKIVDQWWVYDNPMGARPKLICWGSEKATHIVQEKKWQSLLKLAASHPS